jgi:hypothetical protein
MVITHHVHSPACLRCLIAETRVPSANTGIQTGNKSKRMLQLRLQKVIFKCLLHSGSASWIRMQQAPDEPCCKGVLSQTASDGGKMGI